MSSVVKELRGSRWTQRETSSKQTPIFLNNHKRISWPNKHCCHWNSKLTCAVFCSSASHSSTDQLPFVWKQARWCYDGLTWCYHGPGASAGGTRALGACEYWVLVGRAQQCGHVLILSWGWIAQLWCPVSPLPRCPFFSWPVHCKPFSGCPRAKSSHLYV